MINEVERIWTAARRAHGRPRDRRRPSAGIADVLQALLDGGPTHGCELARRSGQSRPNVTARWLPKLDRFGFVAPYASVPGLGHQGGGHPAMVWRLTRAGRELAEALAAERADKAPGEDVAG